MSHEDAIVRREHLESVPTQGQMMRANSDDPDIWVTAMLRLGSEFALNAATDTLPHNSNLAK